MFKSTVVVLIDEQRKFVSVETENYESDETVMLLAGIQLGQTVLADEAGKMPTVEFLDIEYS